MQINFNSYPREVQRENKYLRQALGVDQGNPRYQWAWAGDLNMPIVLLDENSKIIYDYHCACGINVSVHSATCAWTVPRARWEMRNIAFRMDNEWIFVKWSPPESSREDWESTFGSIPYPEGGYFKPVSNGEICIHISSIPYRQTTELIVSRVREHFKKSGREHAQDILNKWDKMDAERIARNTMRFKDAFPVHEGFPGKKENWSHGGVGDSPNLASKGEIPCLPT